MKTCEEYVLKELDKANEIIRVLENEISSLCKVLTMLSEFLIILGKYMSITEGANEKNTLK